jgi:hypothetical protein
MGARDEAVARAKTVIQTLLSTGISAAVFALIPALNLPIIRDLINLFIGKIASFMVEKGEFKAFAYMIDERVSAEVKSFFDSALALNDAQKKGDKDAIKIAEANHIRNADRFLSLVS